MRRALPFSILLFHYALTDVPVGFSVFWLLFSLRSKGSMDHTNVFFFAFVKVFPIEWYQTWKQRTAYTEHRAFLFFLFWCCEWKTKIATTDHISIFHFLILNGEKGKGSSIILFLFSIMESENEKRKGGIYRTWCFSIFLFHLAKEKNKNRYKGSYFYYSIFVYGLGKGEGMLN